MDNGAKRPTYTAYELKDSCVKTPMSHVAKGRSWIAAVVGLSFLVNVLVLTGPLYMLQVYDRVLSSRSIDTLVALSLIMAALFAFMGFFDHQRARILARVGLLWTEAGRMFVNDRAGLSLANARTVGREAESVQRAYTHPAALGAIDVIWMPLFIVALFLLHPLLAGVAIFGILVSLTLSLVGPACTKGQEQQVSQSMGQASALETSLNRDIPTLESMGAVGQARRRWFEERERFELLSTAHGDSSGGWQAISKTFRMFFQSVLLGVGAYLAVQGSLTPGAMIAGSILGGRALAPFDQLLSGLGLLTKGYASRKALKGVFSERTAPQHEGVFPQEPRASLETTGAVYAPPNKAPIVRDLRFRIEAERCVALFGSSGSGKSSALRVMAGAWKPTSGSIIFDGIPLEDWPEDRRAAHIGHLGQDALLPDGSIGDIIRGFRPDANDDEAIAAAKDAAVHESIIGLARGYAEHIDQSGLLLPYGMRRGILRAQALYGKKAIYCLDDPTAGMDAREVNGLYHVLRKRLTDGAAIVMSTHDPDLLRLATHAMVFERGRMVAVGGIAEIVEEYAKALAQHQDRNRIPAGLLPAVMRRMPTAPIARVPDTTKEGVA